MTMFDNFHKCLQWKNHGGGGIWVQTHLDTISDYIFFRDGNAPAKNLPAYQSIYFDFADSALGLDYCRCHCIYSRRLLLFLMYGFAIQIAARVQSTVQSRNPCSKFSACRGTSRSMVRRGLHGWRWAVLGGPSVFVGSRVRRRQTDENCRNHWMQCEAPLSHDLVYWLFEHIRRLGVFLRPFDETWSFCRAKKLILLLSHRSVNAMVTAQSFTRVR